MTDQLTVDEATVAERATALTRNAIRNLATAHRPMVATSCKPLSGPAFIVGAGPSLDKNAHLLAEAQRRGAVFSVNTSSGAVGRHIKADFCVSIESADVSAHLNPEHFDILIGDLASHESVWEMAQAWISSSSPHLLGLLRLLGVEPVSHAGAVTTAAMQLARLWGADPIVLVGMDLAMGHTDQAYAQGAGWDGLTATVDGERLILEGRPDREEAHERAGLRPIYRRPKLHEVESWDRSGVVPTKGDFLKQLSWFADQRPGINATEGGAHIPGWEHVGLAEVLERYRHFGIPHGQDDLGFAACHLTPDQITAAQAWVRDQGNRAAELAADMDAGDEPDWGSLIRGIELPEAMCAGEAVMMSLPSFRADLIRNSKDGGDAVQKKIRMGYEVLGIAAEEVRET